VKICTVRGKKKGGGKGGEGEKGKWWEGTRRAGSSCGTEAFFPKKKKRGRGGEGRERREGDPDQLFAAYIFFLSIFGLIYKKGGKKGGETIGGVFQSTIARSPLLDWRRKGGKRKREEGGGFAATNRTAPIPRRMPFHSQQSVSV